MFEEGRAAGDVALSMELLARSIRDCCGVINDDPLLLMRRLSSFSPFTFFSSASMVADDVAFPGVGIMLTLPMAVPGPTDIRLGAIAGGAAALRLFNDSNSLSFNRNM